VLQDHKLSFQLERSRYTYGPLPSWDLSVRLGYFVTNASVMSTLLDVPVTLGFERKARLFCDSVPALIIIFGIALKVGI